MFDFEFFFDDMVEIIENRYLTIAPEVSKAIYTIAL